MRWQPAGTYAKQILNRLLIEEYFNQILTTADTITDPFEQAFFVMGQVPYLQPFDDVNKRVSRLSQIYL